MKEKITIFSKKTLKKYGWREINEIEIRKNLLEHF